MTTDFDSFDEEWGGVEPAERFGNRIPPGRYQVVCTTNPFEEHTMEDCAEIEAESGNKGLKIWFEILAPETVKEGEKEVKTVGRIIEHVFWITKPNLPYMKRDILTILGKIPEKISTLFASGWAGKTCEILVKDDDYNNEIRSKVRFINPWKPEESKSEESKEVTEAESTTF